MLRYSVSRFIQIVVLMFIYTSIVWFIFYAMPGDITNKFVGNPKIKPAAIKAMKKMFGLDQPLYKRYLVYMRNLYSGHMGVSFSYYPRPVWNIIAERLPRTVTLFLTIVLIEYGIGFYLGKMIAWRRGGFIDYAATVGGISLWTVFTPWWALLLIWAFSYKLGWFPLAPFLSPMKWVSAPQDSNFVFIRILATLFGITIGYTAIWTVLRRVIHDPRVRRLVNWAVAAAILAITVIVWARSDIGSYALDIVWHMTLPFITLVSIGFAGAMLVMRDSMLDTIREDYITTARAKGLPDKVIRDHHAARTALLPLVTGFVLAIAFSLDGAVITETIFSWPGIGLTLLQAVSSEDYPLAVGAYTFLGFIALIAHYIADISYAILDPRISYHRGRG